MIRVYSAQNAFEVHNIKHALEAQGIECVIRGENLRTGIGDLPPIECWAELWILDVGEKELAETVIAGAADRQTPAWTCFSCGESVDGDFDSCWNCQAARPS